ncbi:MAG TPA: phosphonate C-P lyase system protein PhnG [Stellaceae bacterium]|nr:phosphonate C-P lyase system protein PhnG [Stellaceae bacterium]
MSRQILETSSDRPEPGSTELQIVERRRWMAVLAKATLADLEAVWNAQTPQPAYSFLRQAEIGLVMVRGRTGGTGAPFNLGEMTMARCVVRLANGTTGFGHVAGRDRRHAELAAVFDGLLQDPTRRRVLEETLVNPIERRQHAAKAARAGAVAATKVDFFTMVRGE